MVEKLTPGTVFAGYVVERALGSGGMGTVYLARHPRLPRQDAVKVLPENTGAGDEFRARFLREAELAARLDHPNIVAVHDRGVDQGRLWIAMEFVPGIDAAQLVRRGGALAPSRALHIVTETARGLDEAHRCGMLHRDVKPANILLEQVDGSPDRVLIADFGIARAAGDGTALTEVGTVVATLAYAAPELLTDQHIDHRADVYALACTLFQLLTGTTPFPRESVVAVMAAQLMELPPRVTALRPELPPAIDAVIAKAMAKNPDERYSSCGALAAATASAFGHPVDQTAFAVPAPRPPVPPEPPRTVARPAAPSPSSSHRLRYAMITAAVIALVVAITGVVLTSRDPAGTAATPTTTTTAAGSSWGRYAFIAAALPELLPATPTRTGHQGIRCAATDKKGNGADLNQAPGEIATVRCSGNHNPIRDVVVDCSTNRNPYRLVKEDGVVVLGDQRWQRQSGTGRVTWSTMAAYNELLPQSGTLGIEFDEPTRNFCMVVIIGGTSGQDLYDRWWPDAPF